MAKVSSRCLHYFSAAMLVEHRAPPTWRLHTGLCKFAQNISTNIWSLGKRRDLKLGEVSSLPISYNTTISWLYPLNSFFISFHYRLRWGWGQLSTRSFAEAWLRSSINNSHSLYWRKYGHLRDVYLSNKLMKNYKYLMVSSPKVGHEKTTTW